jgi:RNA polymerase sigma-70 factor (ECF subfamily)
MEPSDFELLTRYRGGDVGALEALVERHRRAVFSYIVQMAPSRADAEEAFQDVWLKVMRHADRYRERNFLGWVLRMAHNRLIDAGRRKRPDLWLDGAEEGEEPRVNRLPGREPSPDQALVAAETGRRVAEAVALLPPDQREVFVLRTQGEVPFKEIARIQGVSINTALARMQYALAKLRAALGGEFSGETAV